MWKLELRELLRLAKIEFLDMLINHVKRICSVQNLVVSVLRYIWLIRANYCFGENSIRLERKQGLI